jgi:pimeloyl-ACP methyl ester carboxylesterase
MAGRRAAEQWLDLDGRRAFCRTVPPGPAAGDRPPLVLMHGVCCRSETWQPFVQALARCDNAPALVVPDLPAHGRSAAPRRIFGMDDYARWIERLLCRLSVGRVDLMGHSMGCQVALAVADQQPERVRRIVLLGPTTGRVSTLRYGLGLLADLPREGVALNVLLLGAFVKTGPLRYLMTVREMQRDDSLHRARRIRIPTLVLQGSRDTVIPRAAAKQLARAICDGDYAMVPGATHAAQFSRPDATAQAVLGFLRDDSP